MSTEDDSSRVIHNQKNKNNGRSLHSNPSSSTESQSLTNSEKKDRRKQKFPKTKDENRDTIDKILVSRINQYLSGNNQRSYISLDLIVNHLRSRYKEYGRKPRPPFLQTVKSAMDYIRNSAHDTRFPDSYDDSDDDGNDDSDDDDDDDEITELVSEVPEHNQVNNTILSLYGSGKKPTSYQPYFERDGSPGYRQQQLATPLNANYQSLPPDRIIVTKRKMPSQDVSPTPARKRSKHDIQLTVSNVRFADVGGSEKCLKEVCKMLIHMKHPEVYRTVGIAAPHGFLLHGPPGCGKTLLAHAIAGELDLPLLKVAATELVAGVSGESEERIRELFEQAVYCSPCILFVDEIDAIAPKRETAQREMERRIVAQLLSCMDELNLQESSTQIVVIGATNRPDSLDPALRRAGRFDHEISLGIPDEAARANILQVLCKQLKLSSDISFSELAWKTPGFVGADLMALTREAAISAVNRVLKSLQIRSIRKKTTDIQMIDLTEGDNPDETAEDNAAVKEDKNRDVEETNPDPEVVVDTLETLLVFLKDASSLQEKDLESLQIEKADFDSSLKQVQPSAKREGFITIPNTTWEDIGALKNIREELHLAIIAPVQHPDKFAALNLSSPAGVLLCGPPGCGKTLLAKAVANEAGINFISVKGPELLNMYVGESERAVRQCFQRARNSAPCVIFFDELDALCPRRSDGIESNASARVVNQLLTEMDGIEARKGVFIVAATNRPDIIDPAVMRPGRLEKILYVGLPQPDERGDILKTITKNGTCPTLSSDVNLEDIGIDHRCDGFSGADLAALVREASMCALKEILASSTESETVEVSKSNFDTAFSKVQPSVSDKERKKYETLAKQYSIR